jgi:peptide/nickel transport system ATP-binding protein
VKLAISQLQVSYLDHDHELLALDRVNLELMPGRVTALVGESGSGKTTLGKAVMGLLPPNARAKGNILLDGKDILGLDEQVINGLRWSRMAMVFQNGAANLNPVHRLLDQVAEPLIHTNQVPARHARELARQALAGMGLDPELSGRYPHELSGGQVQRGLLAMALILDPALIILDEPTASLDAMSKSFVASVIKDLKARGKAILLISHDLELASRLADETVVLYLGQVMESLPGSSLLEHPRHPYTLALARSYPGMDAVRDLGGIRGDAFFRILHSHARENRPTHSHAHVASPQAEHENGHPPPQGCIFQPRCTQALPECARGEVDFAARGGHLVRCVRGGIADLLELEGVAKSYGRVKALRTTNLTLKAGEVFCLVGETGSGKSTLAMIAAGAQEPDKGKRIFEGRDMDDWLKKERLLLARRVGIIYQNPADAVSHRLKVFDLVAEPLRIQERGLPQMEVQKRVLAALGDVHLSTSPEFLKRYPHELNMGAIQRLCLARALVHRPRLLIADEPTSSLDPSVQAKVLKMLMDLQTEKGLTMLFVTHDIGLARKVGDRIGIMLAGRLVELGPAARVMRRPGHPYTKLLLDAAKGLDGNEAGPFEHAEAAGLHCPFAWRCARISPLCNHPLAEAANLDGGRHLAWCCNPYRKSEVQPAAGAGALPA